MRTSLLSPRDQGNRGRILAIAAGQRPGNAEAAKGTAGINRRRFLQTAGLGGFLAMAAGGCSNTEKLPPKIASVLDENGQFRPVEELYKLMDNLLINLSHETDAKPHLQEHIPELQ